MTQTQPEYKPISIFEERILAAQNGAFNLASSLAASQAINSLLLYEAEMTEAGGGAPELYTGIEINMKWAGLSDYALGDA